MRNKSSITRKIVLSITTGMAAITLQSCGANKDDKSNGADASGLSGRDKIVHPPKQYYDLLLADRMQIASSGGLSQAQEQVLWINFAGATVKQGFDKDQSFLPCADSVRIPSAGCLRGISNRSRRKSRNFTPTPAPALELLCKNRIAATTRLFM